MSKSSTRSLLSQDADPLATLGANLRTARLRRARSLLDVAQEAGLSAPTLRALERGSPSTSLGALARVLAVLGLEDQIAQLAAPSTDLTGLDADLERLPRRAPTHSHSRSRRLG